MPKAGDVAVSRVPKSVTEFFYKQKRIKSAAVEILENAQHEEVDMWEQIQEDYGLSDDWNYQLYHKTGEIIYVRKSMSFED